MLAIFLDTETTGLDPFSHRLLQIAFKIIDVGTGLEQITYQACVRQPLSVWEARDLASVEINGFTWEKVLSGKDELNIREEIIQIFNRFQICRKKAIYICQNPAFDRNFFAQLIDIYTQEKFNWPYHWLDLASMYWALQTKEYQARNEPFPLEMNVSKNSIAEHFQLPIEEVPHTALNGVNHLLLCYRKLVGFNDSLTFEKKEEQVKISD